MRHGHMDKTIALRILYHHTSPHVWMHSGHMYTALLLYSTMAEPLVE